VLSCTAAKALLHVSLSSDNLFPKRLSQNPFPSLDWCSSGLIAQAISCAKNGAPHVSHHRVLPRSTLKFCQGPMVKVTLPLSLPVRVISFNILCSSTPVLVSPRRSICDGNSALEEQRGKDRVS